MEDTSHSPRPCANPPPLCDSPSGCCSFTGPWTVTRSSLRMLRRVAAFCRPLRPVLLLVSFPRSRSPVVGVLGLCWMWRDVPFACQRRPIIGVLRMCWLLEGSFDCFCCPHTSVHRPSPPPPPLHIQAFANVPKPAFALCSAVSVPVPLPPDPILSVPLKRTLRLGAGALFAGLGCRPVMNKRRQVEPSVELNSPRVTQARGEVSISLNRSSSGWAVRPPPPQPPTQMEVPMR